MQYTEGCYYHIFNRGAHKEAIFFEEENYRYLITLFTKYSVQYKVTVAAYCLMPNHYHLIVKQNEFGSIGSFLKTVFNAYTQAINKRFELSGTLFQGQAKVKEIDSDSYCLQVIRYIHLNPLNAKIVKSIEEWNHSNYLEWIISFGIAILNALRIINNLWKSTLKQMINKILLHSYLKSNLVKVT